MPINRAFQRLKKPRKDGFYVCQKYVVVEYVDTQMGSRQVND